MSAATLTDDRSWHAAIRGRIEPRDSSGGGNSPSRLDEPSLLGLQQRVRDLEDKASRGGVVEVLNLAKAAQ